MAKKYELDVEIGAHSNLDDEIKKMERLVDLREKLKTEVDLIPDSAIKELTDLLNKQEHVSDSIVKQQKKVDALARAREKAAAQALKQESEITKAIIKEEQETQKLQAIKTKAAAEDKKQVEALSNLKKKSSIDQQKEEERLRILKTKAAAEEEKAVTNSLLNEAKIVREIKRQATEKEKAAAKIAKQILEETSVYKRLDKQLSENKRRVKDLLASEKELTAEDRKLIKDTQTLDDKLKKIDRTMGEGKRTVGLYKEGIHEALQETGLLNNGIGRLIGTISRFANTQKESASSSKNFGNALKLGLVGVAIAAAALLKGLLDINQTLKDNLTILVAQVKDLLPGMTDEFEKLARATIQWRDTLLALKFMLNAASREEEDFNEISNDVTLGYKERNEALKEAIRFGNARADTSVEIAKGELALINQEIDTSKKLAGLNSVTAEQREKQFEAQQKLLDAEDVRDDLERQNAARRRERAQEQLIQELDLIQSKRKSSTAQLDIAREQLQNEKIQLEERRKINENLLSVQTKTFEEQIRLLEKNTGIQINQADLLATQDNVLLGRKIRNLNLSAALTDKLAFIVKKAQDAEIESKKNIAKLDEEALKRAQKLNQINRDISLAILADKASDLEKLQDSAAEELDAINQNIFENEKAFDGKLLRNREFAFSKQEALSIALFDKKEELLRQTAANEIKNIEDSVADEKIKAAEILKINEKLQIDLDNLSIEERDTEKKRKKAEIEDNKKLAKEQMRIAVTQADFIVNKLGEALDKRTQKNLDAIDKQEEKQDKALELQQSRAERGLTNTLELQQEAAARLEMEREKEQKKQERREKILSFYNLLSGYAKENPNTALSKAARDIAISEALSLAFAEEGGMVEDIKATTTLKGGSFSRSHRSGDRLVVTSPKEGILTEREVSNLGGKRGFYSLKELLANPMNNDIMFPPIPQYESPRSGMDGKKVLDRLDKIEKAINDKPVSTSKLDNLGNVINETVEKGMKHTLKIMSQKPRFTR